MNKTCPKCKQEKPLSEFYKNRSRKDGLQAWCKDCFRGYQRAYCRTERGRENHLRADRKADRKRRLLYPEKTKARRALQYAVKSGRLIRPTICEDCFQERFVYGHHEDYINKPLEVKWLCGDCHGKEHLQCQSS